MIIAPPLDPACETPEAIQVEAGGLIKEVLDVGHKVHRMCFFEGQGFLLILEEVAEEQIPDPRPFLLIKGGNFEFVIDLFPATATKVCRQPCRIQEGRSWPTSPLRLGSFRCWWWKTGCQRRGHITLLTRWLHTRLPRCASWATDGSTAISMPSRAGSSAILCVTYRGSFIDGGVSSNSPPHRLLWQLYCLLVGHGWPHQVWLSERWCHLGHTQHRCRPVHLDGVPPRSSLLCPSD